MAENTEEVKAEETQAEEAEAETKKKKPAKETAPAEAKGKPKANIDELMDAIKKLTVLELSQLVKAL